MKKYILLAAICLSLSGLHYAKAESTTCPNCASNNTATTPTSNNTTTSNNTATGSTSNNQATPGNVHNNQTGSAGSGSTSGNGCSLNDTSTTFCNPLPDSDIKGFVIRILKTILTIIGVVAVAMIVYGGFRMVASAGNEGEVKSAKKIIINAVMGVVIAGLAYTIIAIIDTILSK